MLSQNFASLAYAKLLVALATGKVQFQTLLLHCPRMLQLTLYYPISAHLSVKWLLTLYERLKTLKKI